MLRIADYMSKNTSCFIIKDKYGQVQIELSQSVRYKTEPNWLVFGSNPNKG